MHVKYVQTTFLGMHVHTHLATTVDFLKLDNYNNNYNILFS